MFLGGALLAVLYLGALWLTLQHLPTSQHPALWFLTSLILRTALILSAFYLLLGDFFAALPDDARWQQGLAALAGFISVRAWVLFRVRQQPQVTDKNGASSL